jgi:serine phosphatase RsbU (regulator of sigma subunit)/anti-sigma regulatory factor (Ser/Thr protein kinase)/FixJ family two-component response regulator
MTTPARKPSAALQLVLVEDDRDYAWLVEEMLREAFPDGGMRVSTFRSLAALRPAEEPTDCLLVDLSLPDGRGLEVLNSVQTVFPGVPLVVLTGAEDEHMALQAVERGAQDYLVKRRVDPDVLGRSIRYAIERSRSERQRAELLQARAARAEAEALSGTLARLQALADSAIGAQGQVDYQELLDHSLALVAADAGALLLRDPATDRLSAVARRGLPHLRSGETLEASGVIGRAFEANGALVVDHLAQADAGALASDDELRSLVAVPLDADGKRIGALIAVSTLAGRFSTEQVHLLSLAGERCARGLANARAYERERRTAAALQTGLLPQRVPSLHNGEIAVRYLPARGGPEVGGDWYDAVVLPDGRVGVAIGDVAGHGAEAAVVMGQLRAALRAYALEGSSPGLVATRLNTLALSLGDPAVATLVYVLLAPALDSGTYVNAGHPAPIVVSREGATMIVARASTPIGVSASADFEEREFALVPGDALCLYSDGLVEARGADRSARDGALLEALVTSAGAEVLCERALAALRPAGAADDDVALLVLRTSATPDGFRSTYPATAQALGDSRAALGEWLTRAGATKTETTNVLVACNEACMNVVEHAYAGAVASGAFTIEGHLDGQTVVVIVRDAGRWSEVRSRGHGRGLKLMEALMDSVQLSFSVEGTVVVLRKTLSRRAP